MTEQDLYPVPEAVEEPVDDPETVVDELEELEGPDVEDLDLEATEGDVLEQFHAAGEDGDEDDYR